MRDMMVWSITSRDQLLETGERLDSRKPASESVTEKQTAGGEIILIRFSGTRVVRCVSLFVWGLP